jgi:AraC-like DNA-binding protein
VIAQVRAETGGQRIRTRIYTWKHVIFLQADSRPLVESKARPAQRLSVTLIIANDRPVRLGLNYRAPCEYEGVLLSPGVIRNSFEADQAGFTLLDVDVADAACGSLACRCRHADAIELSAAEIQHLRFLLRPTHLDPLSCDEVKALYDCVVRVVGAEQTPPRDPRVTDILALIERSPFNQFSLGLAASQVHLSESRLRHLFRTEMGFTLSHYSRWANVRKALRLWRPGTPLGAAALQAGFYDYAHFMHAMKGHFVMTPTALMEGGSTCVVRCDGC